MIKFIGLIIASDSGISNTHGHTANTNQIIKKILTGFPWTTLNGYQVTASEVINSKVANDGVKVVDCPEPGIVVRRKKKLHLRVNQSTI